VRTCCCVGFTHAGRGVIDVRSASRRGGMRSCGRRSTQKRGQRVLGAACCGRAGGARHWRTIVDDTPRGRGPTPHAKPKFHPSSPLLHHQRRSASALPLSVSTSRPQSATPWSRGRSAGRSRFPDTLPAPERAPPPCPVLTAQAVARDSREVLLLLITSHVPWTFIRWFQALVRVRRAFDSV
jgi:hypothetical protein